jgi:hypothetical protein
MFVFIDILLRSLYFELRLGVDQPFVVVLHVVHDHSLSPESSGVKLGEVVVGCHRHMSQIHFII